MPPRMGLTTAGIGVEVVRVSDYYAMLIRSYKELLKERMDDVSRKAKEQ